MNLWQTIFLAPLYNTLIFLVNTVPGHNLGIAIIILTILVKIILHPIQTKTLKNQIQQKQLQPLINEIKKNTLDKKEQAQKIMDLHKEKGSSPFSGCLLLVLQIPVIIALYRVFLGGIEKNHNLLYHSVHFPDQVGMLFLGTFDLTQKSLVLAILAGTFQLIQVLLSPTFKTDKTIPAIDPNDQSPQEQMMESMQKSMRFTLPVMVGIFAYLVPSAVSLYWITSSLFLTLQEYMLQRNLKGTKILTRTPLGR